MAGWIVKYDGRCSRCGTILRAGTEAVWDRQRGRMHCIECPPAVVPASIPARDSGIAGKSARATYERRSAARTARIDQKWGRLSGVVRALTVEPQSTRAWAIGAAGEEELARKLEEVAGLQVLNDRRVPRTRGNIDHIVIAPAGIFVVDAKHMRGLIEVRRVGPFWRSNDRLFVGRRDKSSLAENMGWQVDAVRAALVAGGVQALPRITPVLCFIDGEWPLFRAPNEFRGVRLEGPGSIKKLFAASNALDPADIERFTDLLAEALPAR